MEIMVNFLLIGTARMGIQNAIGTFKLTVIKMDTIDKESKVLN
jgi:hypothetical protein